MDKKTKQHRRKSLDAEELEEMTPPSTSFDTEEGRAAQGMRPDIGKGSSDEERERDKAKAVPEENSMKRDEAET